MGKISETTSDEHGKTTGFLWREMRRRHASVAAPQTDHDISSVVVPCGLQLGPFAISDELTALI